MDSRDIYVCCNVFEAICILSSSDNNRCIGELTLETNMDNNKNYKNIFVEWQSVRVNN